ncbi:hypothetical protein tb265_07410 [Gemmatimonadetes bacterium T265]|nr:hypothetical protein tb265_07410 [Gemmatimonadetes bacterium T265]
MPSTPDASPALDAARERVVRLLTDRYADDTLTVEQFEAELDRLHGLGDVAALEQMASELATGVRPAVARPTVARPAPMEWGVAGAGPAASVLAPPSGRAELGWQYGGLVAARPADDGHLFAVMSSSKRVGPWLVPRRFRAFALMSEAVVDLRDAVLPADGCEIEVGAIMANVKVLLPRGVQADVAVMAFMGSAQDRTEVEPAAGHAPRVRVTGSAVMSEVQVLQGAEAEFAALHFDD